MKPSAVYAKGATVESRKPIRAALKQINKPSNTRDNISSIVDSEVLAAEQTHILRGVYFSQEIKEADNVKQILKLLTQQGLSQSERARKAKEVLVENFRPSNPKYNKLMAKIIVCEALGFFGESSKKLFEQADKIDNSEDKFDLYRL